jgi:hypothetical protein
VESSWFCSSFTPSPFVLLVISLVCSDHQSADEEVVEYVDFDRDPFDLTSPLAGLPFLKGLHPLVQSSFTVPGAPIVSSDALQSGALSLYLQPGGPLDPRLASSKRKEWVVSTKEDSSLTHSFV